METKDGILLESGTGEVEILEFTVKGEHYAINVVKVKEILHIDNIAKVPNAHQAVTGIALIRGNVVTVIDMRTVLENEINENVKQSMTLVCEFNQMQVAFSIDEVLGISRIKWSDIKKPSTITADGLVIGNIKLKDNLAMLLDFEKIVMDISPASGISVDRVKDVAKKDRSHYNVILADDSPMIRQVLLDALTTAGFQNMKFFHDGQKVWEYLETLWNAKGDKFKEDVDLLITDIEMPQLDGHTLTRRIKEHKGLRKLPIVIFSSLITGDLKHKGDAVGADAQMSKPEIGRLVSCVDKLLEA